MVRHIDRIQAQQDLRAMNVFLVAGATVQGDKEALPNLRAALMDQMGTVMRFKEKPTEAKDILSFMQDVNKPALHAGRK
jgi:hypothetical protein